ncbi:MAG: hypothetical protein HYV07_21035 [Deltaproteobacteria bacterium]|nr:hypothetical protein [Deltaproteobacteria bacterium]
MTYLEPLNAAGGSAVETEIATLAHDLRSPLRQVATCAGLLRKRQQLMDAQSAELLDLTVGGCRRMEAMIRGLEEYCALAHVPMEIQVADPRELVERATHRLQGEIESTKATIVVGELPESLACCPAHLAEVFAQLISNSLTFHAPDRRVRVEVGSRRSGGELELFVADDGLGVPEEARLRVFGLFQRARAEDRGPGVGLALCRRILERHRGRIWVEAGQERGSVFRFVIPEATLRIKASTQTA